jgi:hypothetical protein
MTKKQESGFKKVVSEIREEATRQLRGFPDEINRQVTRGWGQEFARQIFGTPRHRRRRA